MGFLSSLTVISSHKQQCSLGCRLHSLSVCYVNYSPHVSPPVIVNFPLVPLRFYLYLYCRLSYVVIVKLSYVLPLSTLNCLLSLLSVLAGCHHNGIVL